MPILADIFDQLTPSKPVVVVPIDDRRLEFESLDGVDLISWSGGEWIVRSGISGLDVPPRNVIRDTVPGLPGSRLIEIRDLEREVFLPVTTRPDDRDYRSNLKQLAMLRSFMDYRTSDYTAADGTFDLVAYSDSGRRTLRCTYLEGLEGDYGADVMFSSWRMLGITLLAVDPYWHGEQWSTPVVGLPTPQPFLSNDPAAHPWGLAPSVALGTGMPVTVTGDVPSPAMIELIGPSTSTRISSPGGLDVTIGAVADGQVVTVNTGRRKQVLLDGVPAWTLLGDSPQWRPLPPGDTTVSIQILGASPATRARVYGTALWESAW